MIEKSNNSNSLSLFRDDRLDSVKYWLMFLVVAGHVFERCSSPGCVIASNWIYLFHMPLFVFLSGYFSHKKDTNSFFSSCWKLFEPLIVFQIIMRGMEFFLTGSFSWMEFLFTPIYVLWYLLSLFFWRLLIQVIPDKVFNHKTLVIVIAFLIGFIAGFLPLNKFLSLQRTFAFLPFFILGYCMKGKNLFLNPRYKPLCLVFLVLTMAVPLWLGNWLGDMTHSLPYSNIFGLLKRMFAFGLSIPMSIAFINICPNNSWTKKQGRLTMQYYIYHAFIVRLLGVVIIMFSFPQSFFAATIYSLLIMIILGAASFLPHFKQFVNPLSSFIFKKAV